MIKIQRRIEEQEEASLSLVPPHGIICKHDDMTLADRDVDNRGRIRQFRPSGQHATD